jgi:hypothetical protein
MRTTITLSDKTHAFASFYAQARGLTLSAAIDELIRKAEAAPPPAPPEICYSPSGLPMFSPSGGIVTAELIEQIEAEEYDPQAFA